MENRLLNRERIERMISAPSEDEALKVLDECGYDSTAGGSVESRLAGARAALLDEVQAAVPEPRLPRRGVSWPTPGTRSSATFCWTKPVTKRWPGLRKIAPAPF